MTLTVGSLFTGVGGFDLGMEAAGWQTAWQVEWDKHCQQILARHWPDVPRWADVRDVNGSELPPVDCITFGSPCQDLSVAGKRAGLEGERSGLFHEAIRIIKEMRHATAGTFPRVAIWENVAGALSSNRGADFGTVLDTLADIGALVIEWHILDARWFGVPQRRRRVFVTAVFDPAAATTCPDPLFPVGTRSRWHPPTGDTAREDVAGTLGGGSDGRGWAGDTDRMTFVPTVAGTLNAGGHPGSYNGQDAYNDLLIPTAYVKSTRPQSSDHPEVWREDDTAPTLNGFDTGETRSTVLAFSHTQGLDCQPSTEHWPTLRTEGNGHAVATATAVRRLTPVKCERLMGWPDDHTRWTSDGREQADSHRYRQCGNGVASPVAAWLGTHLRNLMEQ